MDSDSIIPDDAMAIMEASFSALGIRTAALCAKCGAHHKAHTVRIVVGDSDGFVGAICACGAVAYRAADIYGVPFSELVERSVSAWNADNGLDEPFVYPCDSSKTLNRFKFVGAIIRSNSIIFAESP